jgi:hypothetical protein
MVAIHSSGQTIFSFTHIEDITLGVGEEVDKVAGGSSSMGVDRIARLMTRLVKICIILHYNMYYFHFTLQEPC